MKVILSATAQRDLRALHRSAVRNFGKAKADTYLGEIHRVIGQLSRHPKLARLRTEFKLPLRIFPTGAHVIVYEAGEERVRILRVLHGHQNTPDHL